MLKYSGVKPQLVMLTSQLACQFESIALFPIQLLAIALGKAQKMVQILEIMPPVWERSMEFLAPDFSLA